MIGADSIASQEEQKHEEMFFVSPREDLFNSIKKSVQKIREQNGEKEDLITKAVPLFSKANFCKKEECDPNCRTCYFVTFLLFKENIKELRKIHGYGNAFIVFKVNEFGIAEVDYTL